MLSLIHIFSILVLACHDVDEGERRRIGAAHVLYIGVGEQQLIGNLIGEELCIRDSRGVHEEGHREQEGAETGRERLLPVPEVRKDEDVAQRRHP